MFLAGKHINDVHCVTLILSVYRVTNGGKTTLTNKLIKTLPNCCVVHQDDFFKVSFSKLRSESVLFVIVVFPPFSSHEHCMSIVVGAATSNFPPPHFVLHYRHGNCLCPCRVVSSCA